MVDLHHHYFYLKKLYCVRRKKNILLSEFETKKNYGQAMNLQGSDGLIYCACPDGVSQTIRIFSNDL